MATDTALPPVVPAEIPIAVNAGELPGESELAQFRAAMAKGQVPGVATPTPPSPPPAPAQPAQAQPSPAPAQPDEEADTRSGPWWKSEINPDTGQPFTHRQQYINFLVAGRTRAELRAEELEKRLTALEGRGTGASPAPAQPEATRPKPTEAEVGTKYATYGDFVEDLADWKVEQREAVRTRTEQASAAETSEQSAIAAYQSRIPAAQARHADFDAVTARPLPAPMTPTLKSAIRASEIGPDLAYHLTTHPDEYQRIRALPVGLALMAIGRLEAQLQAGFTPAAASPTPTPLPAPMAPVGGHVTASTPDAATADLATFRAVIKPKFGMRG